MHSEEIQSSQYVKDTTKKFLEDFLAVYHRNEITPYLHCMCHHLPEQHFKYGNLNYFSAQGLEKLNDMSTSLYFNSTNKKGAIKQMLERDFRESYLEEII